MALKPQAAHRKDLTAGIGPMEHRHFATVATIIREMGDGAMPVDRATREMVAYHFAERLRETNPNFDKGRFLRACLPG